MFVSKMSTLKPLIESNEGQHLTAYLKNDQNIFQLRRQLRETLDAAYEYLSPVMKPDALVRFLAPLHNTLEDTKLLKSLKGNVGLFRNEKSFRILSLPVSVEQTCVVATSFHVKPLLRWIQADREFLLLGIGDGYASLYQGGQSQLNLIDTILFPEELQKVTDRGHYEDLKRRHKQSAKFDETVEWMNDWLTSLTKETKPRLFVAGQAQFANRFLKESRYEYLHQQLIWPSFSSDKIPEITSEIRSVLKREAKKYFEQTLMEFYHAEDLNLASKNIFQIAKAVLKGRVKKLIIADGINIFGKIDRKSGGLAIHPTHLDHEDDDILDDLAQEVLAQGGQVVVASQQEIPSGRPILAILEYPETELLKQQSRHSSLENKIERRVV